MSSTYWIPKQNLGYLCDRYVCCDDIHNIIMEDITKQMKGVIDNNKGQIRLPPEFQLPRQTPSGRKVRGRKERKRKKKKE